MNTKTKLAALALVTCALSAQAQTSASAPAASPAKKELINRLLVIQTANAENMARNMVSAPLGPMGQEVRIAMQQVPAEKREAVGKAIEGEVRKFADDAVPLVKERIVKLAPETVGKMLDERFSEDELRQLVAWLESPLAKKFDATSPELGRALQERLMADVGQTLNTRLGTLRGSIVKQLGLEAPKAGAPASKPVPAKK